MFGTQRERELQRERGQAYHAEDLGSNPDTIKLFERSQNYVCDSVMPAGPVVLSTPPHSRMSHCCGLSVYILFHVSIVHVDKSKWNSRGRLQPYETPVSHEIEVNCEFP